MCVCVCVCVCVYIMYVECSVCLCMVVCMRLWMCCGLDVLVEALSDVYNVQVL